jgi:adenylate kinase family enzyme
VSLYNSFLENTKPLIEYYDNKNKLRKIDVNRNVEDIFKDIVDVII